MNENDIRQLPINDEFAQCMRKLRIVPNEIREKRQEQIRNCNHLFVKIRVGKEVHGFNSTDYYKDPDEVECLHCGLTNRYNQIETILEKEYIECFQTFRIMTPSLTRYNKRTLESQLFTEIFKKSYVRGGKSFKNSTLNLISEECLLTYHPSLLYRLALQINPSGNNDELFEIMKQLHSLETNQEKIRLQTEEQAISLLKRYYALTPKNLVLRKVKTSHS